VGGVPAEPLLDEGGDAIIIGPDDVSLNLAKQMAQGVRLLIILSSAKGIVNIEYDLDGFGRALDKINMNAY